MVDYEKIAKKMLRLTHAEIVSYGGILSDYFEHGQRIRAGTALEPTRQLVIKTALEYGKSFKLKKAVVEKVFTEIKNIRGFSRFKAL